MDSLGLLPSNVVLEIGAGRGDLTEMIASRAGSVVAVELDSNLAALLRRKFDGNAKVRVLEADILQVPIDAVAREAGRDKIKVCGNLPYYITSPCLLHLFHYHAAIEAIVVMVQEEVARPTRGGRRSTQPRARIRKVSVTATVLPTRHRCRLGSWLPAKTAR